MFRRNTRFIATLVVIVFLFTSFIPAMAADMKDLQKQQKSVKSQLKDLKKNINMVDKEKKDIISELSVIDSELGKAQNELAKIQASLKTNQAKLADTRRDLEAAQDKVEEQKEDLNVRMKALYMMGPVDYIEVLLSATSFSDFLTRLDMVKRLIDSDKQLLAEFKAKKELVEKKKEELERQQSQIYRQQRDVSAKKAVIASRKSDRQRLLSQLEKQKKEYENKQDQLEKDAKRLANMIYQMQAKSNKGYMGTGSFHWPVPASTRVTSEYGWRTHPIFKTKRFHNGIDIGAPTGTKVVAADDGQVIYTGSYGGYGKTVIIDHGGQVSTQYSHLSNISVSNGTKVNKGDVVGLVGSTGWSTGPHLHFTVYKNGQHASPWNWLR